MILIGLRRSGYGRLLFAVGDNPIAARLSGARSWQVLLVLYVMSALLAAVAGFLIAGLDQHRQRQLAEQSSCHPSPPRSSAGPRSSAAAAATAGRSSGALILTVVTALLRSSVPEAVRQILFGAIIVVVAAAYTRVTAET